MKQSLFAICISFVFITGAAAQDMVVTASNFIHTLEGWQKAKALYPFDVDERYNFHFFPKEDRKGVTLNELTPTQRQAAFKLLRTCLSDEGVNRVKSIISLETILKELERRKPEDNYRDTGKYYLTVFGLPANNTIWGWRFEGHHVSFTFSADKKKLVAATPAFLGSNPAIVQQGPEKGKQVLKEEADLAFSLLASFEKTQLEKAVIDANAPNEIITFVSRTALIDGPSGILYNQMTATQKQQFLQLIKVYIHRYTKLFADEMLKEIQQAGLDNLSFAWAGAREPVVGKAHYYRIKGPTIVIEYDNSQNNANHVHSVIRHLKKDFGGDVLLQHYKASHQ